MQSLEIDATVRTDYALTTTTTTMTRHSCYQIVSVRRWKQGAEVCSAGAVDRRQGLLARHGSADYSDVSLACTFVPGNETTAQWTFVPRPGTKLPVVTFVHLSEQNAEISNYM